MAFKIRLRRFIDDKAGATAVEFAMVAVLFLSLVFGILEGGRIFWTWNALQSAVEQTTRYALTNSGATDTQLKNYVATSMASVGPNTSNLTVTVTRTTVSQIKILQLDGSYAYNTILPLLPSSWNSLTLKATARLPVP